MMTGSDPDRLQYLEIAGAAAHHAHGWQLSGEEEAAAIAEIRQAAAGRVDLLAERAGTALGYADVGCDAARCRQIAKLCIAAGADQALIERWVVTGRERAAPAGRCAIPAAPNTDRRS